MTAFHDERFQPVGDTDSEYAFCLMMNAIARAAQPGEARPSPKKLLKTIRPIVDDLAGLGEFNFILSDGESVRTNGRKQRITLLATAPLTAEPWQPLAPNSLRVYTSGHDITPAPRPTRIRPRLIGFDVLTAAVA